jgi:cellulose synthase/poly-beta-1,6-N-acetylglucosamine synthase-like glycosyltransferase
MASASGSAGRYEKAPAAPTSSLVFVAALALVITLGGVWLVLSLADLLLPTHSTGTMPIWAMALGRGFLIFYCAATILPFSLFVGWRSLARRQRLSVTGNLPDLPFVSIVIPAFNEQGDVRQALHAAVSQSYPAYEVILVDDGSSDLTASVALDTGVHLVRLPCNAGKAAALNVGIELALGSIIVFSDGDSVLDPNATRYLVEAFDAPEVGAVAGRVVIAHADSYLRRLQDIEYIAGQDLHKAAQLGSTGSVLVCPGPVCAWRRSALTAIGGFSARTLTEDYEATVSTLAAGFRVGFAPRAVAYTSAPDSWGQLYQQRLRWSRGALQTLWWHRRLMGNARLGLLGLFWLPYGLFMGFGATLVESLALLAIIPAALLSGAALHITELALLTGFIIDGLTSLQLIVALILARAATPALLCTALLLKPFTILLTWSRVLTILRELRRSTAAW